MSVTIRIAQPADLEVVQQLGSELLNYEREKYDSTLETDWPFSEQGKTAYQRAIDEKFTILAEVDNQPVGYLIGSVHHSNKDNARQTTTAQLENIFIRSNARHQGVGQQLFNQFKEYCVSEGVDTINVTVNAKNQNATDFYTSTGFTPSRIILSQDLR